MVTNGVLVCLALVPLLVTTRAVAVEARPSDAAVAHHWIFQTNSSIVYTHMSMLGHLPDGRLVAAFQGSSISEGCNDQSIFVTSSNDNGSTWSDPVVARNDSYANWGPVLHYDAKTDTLWLFFSVSTQYQNREGSNCGSFGRSYPGGEVKYVISRDGGQSWSSPTTILPFQARGQVSKVTANVLIVTTSGRWMLPFWQEPRTKYDKGIGASAVLISDDGGASWSTRGNIHNNSTWLIENTVHQFPSGHILQLFRTQTGYIYESVSTDNGDTWTVAQPTALLNPNSKVCLTAEAVNGSAILAYNPSKTERRPLVLAQSSNAGSSWSTMANLDSDASESYEYPTSLLHNGKVLTSYSANSQKGIKLAVYSLA